MISYERDEPPMKKTLALTLLFLFMLTALTSCQKSAFDHPEDYVSLPPLDEIRVTQEEIDKAMEELEADILDGLTGEYFTPLTESGETVRLGDKATVRYSGAPTSSSVKLSEEAEEALSGSDQAGYGLIVGSDTLPEKVENALIGKKAGESVSVTVTYTEDDTDIEDLVGVEVELKIEILEIARLFITERHAVKLKFTASLPDGIKASDEIETLLEGGVETVTLSDQEDSFDTAFTIDEIRPHLLGHGKYDELTFTLTLDSERASEYGYDEALPVSFTATILEASETPEALTDELIEEMTGGIYNKVDDYRAFCLKMVKEDLALRAVSSAATFADEMPEKEYNEFYEENYNAALYATMGDVSGYTAEELAALMSEEVANKINETAHDNTIVELHERFLLEYLFDLLDLSLTEEEYNTMLQELYDTYTANYSYMLLYYGIDSPAELEEYIGREYAEVQFLYEKLLPVLGEKVTFTD